MRTDERYGVGWVVRVKKGLYVDEEAVVLMIEPTVYDGRDVLVATVADFLDGSGDIHRFFYEDCVAVKPPERHITEGR